MRQINTPPQLNRSKSSFALGLSVAVLAVAGCGARPQEANSPPTVTTPAAAKYMVYGTCLSGGCGLKQRSGPGSNFHEVDRYDRLSDGVKVEVVCQASGEPPDGYESKVWDKLPNGLFVSDAFVDTPNRQGSFSESLLRCDEG